jgi:hypothetical protein
MDVIVKNPDYKWNYDVISVNQILHGILFIRISINLGAGEIYPITILENPA